MARLADRQQFVVTPQVRRPARDITRASLRRHLLQVIAGQQRRPARAGSLHPVSGAAGGAARAVEMRKGGVRHSPSLPPAPPTVLGAGTRRGLTKTPAATTHPKRHRTRDIPGAITTFSGGKYGCY